MNYTPEKLDHALREICEKEVSQGNENDKYDKGVISHLVSLGYVESHGSDIWQKVTPTVSGKAFLASGGFKAEHEKELAQKRQDEFLEFQRKFMDYQHKMLEEQHRHIVVQDKKMLLVATAAAVTAFLNFIATIIGMFA